MGDDDAQARRGGTGGLIVLSGLSGEDGSCPSRSPYIRMKIESSTERNGRSVEITDERLSSDMSTLTQRVRETGPVPLQGTMICDRNSRFDGIRVHFDRVSASSLSILKCLTESAARQ